MSPERWQRIQNVFGEARTHSSHDCAAFLENACSGDEEMRREVEWMLAHEAEAQGFLQLSALEFAAKSLGGNPSESLTGLTLGSYHDLRLIGRGGMGEVYRARDSK